MTPIDVAHAAMEAAPDDDAARLRFYERLGDAELELLLEAEPEGDQIAPQVFPVDGVDYVLAFDRTERLAAFAEATVPHVTLSGRVLAGILAGQGIGLGVNVDVAPSSILIPPDAVAWLADTLAHGPAQAQDAPSEIRAPAGLPESLITALDAKLATAAGLAQAAYLAGVTYRSGTRGHMLAFVGAEPAAEAALARAANEALVFSGIEAGALDVTFLDARSTIVGALTKHGLRFDLPQPIEPAARPAPGSDPEKPPSL
ncbi:type III secretion system (T3SS) SseB-like protein [Litoreibacter ponti]|uniref:Type III secretion system (T3SS) SseB-like protein n=1 Tax=Litoreibacter ponti TaxID=1510457 RepID=A0A2T6BMX7_9RHOB|nr:SseB family protein [Litoreibacter ponti]PTX57433.1 type III secretion system (T3SS) SseB-like protein [Litoreibacter ponti]